MNIIIVLGIAFLISVGGILRIPRVAELIDNAKVTPTPVVIQKKTNINLFTTPTLTPIPYKKKVNTQVVKNSYKCVGPDGKYFQTTQKECDEFNKAWETKKASPTVLINNNSTQINTNNNSGVIQACLAGKRVLADICTGMCEMSRSTSMDICNYKVSMEERSQCREEATETQQSCFDKCISEFNTAIDRCFE